MPCKSARPFAVRGQASKLHSPSASVSPATAGQRQIGLLKESAIVAVSHSKHGGSGRHTAVCGISAKVFGRLPPTGDRISSPQGVSTAGESTNLFSFKGLCKPPVSFCFHNRYGRIPPAARSACPQNFETLAYFTVPILKSYIGPPSVKQVFSGLICTLQYLPSFRHELRLRPLHPAPLFR